MFSFKKKNLKNMSPKLYEQNTEHELYITFAGHRQK